VLVSNPEFDPRHADLFENVRASRFQGTREKP
jgi:hypothetical protein